MVAVLLVVCLWRDSRSAQDQLKMRSDQPIQVKSNELSTDSSGRVATFSGKVTAKQGDVTIYCDRLVVKYGESEREVSRVEAYGNVRIVQGNQNGQAGRAVYDRLAGTIVLEDNPRVSKGENTVTGKVITIYLNEEKSVVTGGPDRRVEATIHPRGASTNVGSRP